MKYYRVGGRKPQKEDNLVPLDKAILEKCKYEGMNISRMLKAGKPYYIGNNRSFATTDEVLASLTKLQKLGILERR